jgi:hypothetical protein
VESAHSEKKRKEMDIKILKMYWFLGGKNHPLSLENKLLLYKAIIKPIWTYGIELWGCSSKSNVNITHRFQSKTLRMIAGAPRYVSNPNAPCRHQHNNGGRRTAKKSRQTFPAIKGTRKPISHQLGGCKKPETAQANLTM